MRAACCGLFSSLLLLSPVVSGEELSGSWLQSKVNESRQVSYSGQSILVAGDQTTSFAVLHASIDGKVWEHVLQKSGGGAEIVRQGDRLVCVGAGVTFETVANTPAHLRLAETGISAASELYQFNQAGADRIADRETVRVEVIPRDQLRYGYRLWVDAETGVVLKSSVLNAQRDTLETYEFVNFVRHDHVDRADFLKRIRHQEALAERLGQEGAPAPASSGADAGFERTTHSAIRWEPAWLPEGFLLIRRAAGMMGRSGVSSQLYSDGLAAFTLFRDEARQAKAGALTTGGATVAYHVTVEDALVTVVGEIPLTTAERIANSIRSVGENSKVETVASP